ncbi:thioredoxin [Xenopus laevis]|nr:thioredoxin [Xenopus laevis]
MFLYIKEHKAKDFNLQSEQTDVKMVRIIKNMEEVQRALQESGEKLVVIKFFAQWCGNCRRIAPEFEKLIRDYPGTVFCQVDVDDASILSQQYQIRSVPTFIFYKGLQKIEEFTGADAMKLRNSVQMFC